MLMVWNLLVIEEKFSWVLRFCVPISNLSNSSSFLSTVFSMLDPTVLPSTVFERSSVLSNSN